jgi:hypothetical protein
MVSSPKTLLQVPAISSKALESDGVMGAGSRAVPPGMERVMWELEFLGVGLFSKEERVKFRDLTSG